MNDAEIAESADLLRDRGWVVMKDVVPEGLLRRIDGSLQQLEAGLIDARRTGSFEGGHARPTNLLGKDVVFADAATFAPILSIARMMLGHGLLLNSLASLVVEPRTPTQPLHSDDQVIRFGTDRPMLLCTAIWALNDFVAGRGATEIVEATHSLPDPLPWGEPSPFENERRPVEMSRGSILVLNGAIYHGAGANTSSVARRAIGVSYCAGFLRPVENQLLGVPSEVLRTFSPELLELCALRTFGGIVDHVDRREPIEVLRQRWDRLLEQS